MRVYGLIGHPIKHSFSKLLFDKKFKNLNQLDCQYLLFDSETIKDVVALKKTENICGLNVTIPYKQTIIPYLDYIGAAAKSIGAVNVVRVKNGRWEGYNTDVLGFEKSLIPLLTPDIKKALVFGSGGSYKAVNYVLQKLGIPCSQVSRSSHKALFHYNDISKYVLHDHQLIINTTPVGMFPNVNETLPFPFHLLGPQHLVYDLIYNPEITLLLKNAAINGSRIKNGLEMLQIQADESWKIWNRD